MAEGGGGGGGAPRDERTEEATPHRLAEARRQGNFPTSREPAQALALLAALLWSALVLPSAGAEVAAAGATLLARAGEVAVDGPGGAVEAALAAAPAALLLLAPLLALLFLAAPLASALQRTVALDFSKLAPDLSRLDPIAGAGRLASARALSEFARNALKVAAALALVAWLLRSEVGTILRAGTAATPAEALAVLGGLVRRVLVGVAALALLVAAVDLLVQRLLWLRSLRMTRQELKDELKSTEGHPEVRARIRGLQRERARRRMMADVPKATVVIANPTHYAVALGYDQEREPVPRVLAKGRDLVALRIREVAAAVGVPVVEDPPTARLLHASLEIGEVIRPEHYRAVAEIVGYVLARRNPRPPNSE